MTHKVIAIPRRSGSDVFVTHYVVIDGDRVRFVRDLLVNVEALIDAMNAPGSPFHLPDVDISGREVFGQIASSIARCVLELRLAEEAGQPAA